jgi:xanthosine utilization system XapX-like protein
VGYLVSLAAGVLVGAVLVVALKSLGPSDADVATV